MRSDPIYEGSVYVQGSLRGQEGEEYYLLSGEYDIKDGWGGIIVYNSSEGDIIITKDSLLTRSSNTQHLDSSRI